MATNRRIILKWTAFVEQKCSLDQPTFSPEAQFCPFIPRPDLPMLETVVSTLLQSKWQLGEHVRTIVGTRWHNKLRASLEGQQMSKISLNGLHWITLMQLYHILLIAYAAWYWLKRNLSYYFLLVVHFHITALNSH